MVSKSDLVTIRDAVDADRDFIFATWLRGLRYGNDWFEAIDSIAYFQIYHAALERALDNSNNSIKVACLKDDPEVILGYAVYAGNRVDFVFVKKAWRSIGIAKSLIPVTMDTVTHLTKVGVSILKKHPKVKFNPFAFN